MAGKIKKTNNKPKTKPKLKKQPPLLSPKLVKFKSFKPEYTKKVSKSPKNKKTNINFKRYLNWLNINAILIINVIIGISILLFVIFMANLYFAWQSNNKFYADIQKQYDIDINEYKQKQQLIGNKSQLQSEITNYQSLPEDLGQWVLRDYAVFKSKCIVNGQYIGPTTYIIDNVVYDKYAKIYMNCEGEDAQIVAKIGGRWAVVHSGNTAPNCLDVNSLDLPQGVAKTCTDGRILYPNPNP
jgi:hypothetical protein